MRKTALIKILCFSLIVFSLLIYTFKRDTYDPIWYLRDFKYVLAENMNILPNYISSFDAVVDTIYLDINKKEWQKLKADYDTVNYNYSNNRHNFALYRPEYRDVQIRDGVNGNLLKAKARLKGGQSPHWSDIDRLSFHVKTTKNGKIQGLKKFNLHHPRSRNYMQEYVYHKLLEYDNLKSVRFDFIRLIRNDEDMGIYNIEEIPGEEFILRNGYSDGVVFRNKIPFTGAIKTYYSPKQNDVSIHIEEQLRQFLNEEIPVSNLFNVDALSKFTAMADLVGHYHGIGLGNLRFYFNPKVGLIEPIGHDNDYILKSSGLIVNITDEMRGKQYDWVEFAFKDSLFYRSYIENLTRYSQPEFLDSFFDEYGPQIDSTQRIIYQSYPTRRFRKKEVLYENQNLIRKYLVDTNKAESDRIRN